MNIVRNKKIIVVGAISIMISVLFTACGNKENESKSTTTNQASVEQKQSNDVNKVEKDKKVEEKQEASKKVVKNTSNAPKLTKQFLGKNTQPKFATSWKNSSSKNLSACIDGKGPEAEEEGVGKIFIKDKDGNINSFEVSDKKLTPKYLNWVDDENLLLILSSPHGTLAKGGSLYLMNASTGKLVSIVEITDKKQQIVEAEKSGNNLKLKANVFDDDNFNKSHIENWTINSFDTSMSNKMEVKNSQGKVIYNIN